MAGFGLLLGGGGSVGIAWENGVLAGLADAIGFEPVKSTVIVGTSAGSSVGADMALGKDPHDALALDRDSSNPRRKLPPPDLEKGAFAEIIALMLSPEAGRPETVARIAEIARDAETALSEDQFVAMFKKTVGTDEWPDVDFRPTSTACSTGKPKFWTATDGVPLSRAVASSCAIPGYFPTVSHAGEHYMDGARGPRYHTGMVKDLELDSALFVGPRIAVPRVSEMLVDDMEALEATGVRVHTILGSERLDALGLNLMDYSKRPAAFECGLADGADHAAAVKEVLNSQWEV
jgi:NTE family protein